MAAFGQQLEVSAAEQLCVITLPLKTADDRYIDIFIEPTTGNFIYVHDGGKNTAELYTQGIHLTDKQTGVLHDVARRHGAVFQNGRFQIACPSEARLPSAILAICQCVTLTMMDIVTHEARIEDEPITARIQRSLNKWKPDYVDIRRRFPVKGKQIGAEHWFDFVSFSRDLDRAQHVALKILPPSFGSRIQADRYGFMVLDIHGRDVADWPRLAIVSKVDEWSEPALKIVRELSADTIELETDDEKRVESILPGKMTELSEAA